VSADYTASCEQGEGQFVERMKATIVIRFGGRQ
jgi:hypothetical protein